MKTLALRCLMLSLPLLARTSWAETSAELQSGQHGPKPHLIHVRTEVADPVFEVRIKGREKPVAHCVDACWIALHTGTYMLRYGTTATRTIPFYVDQPGTWLLRDQDKTWERLGLGMGVSGILVFLGGVLTFGYSYACTGCEQSKINGFRYVGAAAMGVGAVAIPVGWGTFVHNFRPRPVEDSENPLSAAQTWSPQLMLGSQFLGIRSRF